MNRLLSPAAALSLALVLNVSLPTQAPADAVNWQGGGASLNWSESLNWDVHIPGISDALYFGDAVYSGYTNVAGAVNNIVDSSTTVGAMAYTANSSNTAPLLGKHLFTTLIPSGSVLTLAGNVGEPTLMVGNGITGSFTNYTTITGAGSLVVNNPASLIEVQQVSRATLDLSGLNTFTANIGNLWVGADPVNSGHSGVLLLARTNNIMTAANANGTGVLLGRSANSSSSGAITMGQVNNFNTDGLVVGGTRGNAAGTKLSFTPGAANPTFKLRGSAGGSSRTAIFSIGDISAEEYDYLAPLGGNANGAVDFTGGTVDIRADSIYVARSAGDIGGGGNFTTAGGSLLVENGTVDANNLYIAYKQGTNGSYANPSSLTLSSNAVMTVNQNVSLAFRAGVTNGPVAPIGTLLVSNNATLNVGGSITHGDGSVSTIGLGGGTINMTGAGNIYAYGLSGFGTISGANNITVTNNFVVGPVGTAGTLNLGGNLTLANPFPVVFDLGPNNTTGSGVNDLLNVTGNVSFNNNPVSFTYNGPLLAGSSYSVVTFSGSRSGLLAYTNDTRSQVGLDQSTPGQVNLVVTNWNPATIVWQGTVANATNVWSTATNLYWTNTAAGIDKYYQGDAVIFDDTALNPTIYPNGKLFPASITVNCSAQNIVITNRSQAGPYSGVIGGNCGITKNGTGTLTFGTYSNSFTGPINVNNGIWKLFDPNFVTPPDVPTLGSINSTMYINNGATLDFFGVGQTATGKPLVIAGNGYNGLGAFTNSSTSASVNGFLVTLAADARVSAETSALGLKSGKPGTPAPLFSGLLNLNGFTLTKWGANRFSLQDIVATNSGNLNVATGLLAVANSIIDGPGSLNFSNGTYLSFGIGSTLSTTGYVGKAINMYNGGIVANVGNSAVPAVINSPVNLLGTLSVTNTQPIVMNGIISGGFGITKYGTSNLVLNVANNYTGPTVVTAGGLALGIAGGIPSSPSIQISPGAVLDVTAKPGTFALASGQTLNLNGSVLGDITAANGSTLLGSGIIAGSLKVAQGAEFAPATTNVTGTVVVSNNLTLGGGHYTWEMAPSFDLSDALVVGGNLILSNINSFTVSSIGGFDPSGTNTLITYSGALIGGLSNLVVNSSARFTVAFVDPALTPGKLQIRLITASPSIVWTGTNATHPTWWDVKTTTNWNNAGTPDVFWSSDLVNFDSTGGTNVVDLISTLGPASVEVANSTYYFRGAGSLVTASLTNDNSTLVISNTANNFLTGAGLIMNSGTTTFSQPTNATLAANLVGGGTFSKAGNSNLTVTGNSVDFYGALNVDAGTLRAGSSNVLGTGNATVASGATLDVNGQVLTSVSSLSISGIGADGFGAVNNRGAGRTNSLANVTLGGNTTLGALSNAWGIVNSMQGNGFALTKTNANDVWVMTGGDTDLGDLNVRQGRLVFSAAGTTLGRASSNIVVFPNAVLAFATTNAMPQSGLPPAAFDAGAKPIVLSSNGVIETIGFPVNQTSTNTFSGSILMTNNGIFRVGGNSQLILNGPISGTNAQLVLTNGGTLFLNGTNTYTSNTLVYAGTLVLSNAAALPSTNMLILSNNIATGNPALQFVGSPVFSTSNIMRFTAVNGITSIGGDGTWNGPIFMYGSNVFQISGGPNLLNLAGPLITTNAGGAGSLQFHGSNTRIAGSLRYSGSVTFGVGDGLSAGFDERFTTVRFDSTNNWTSVANFERGRIIIGTNDALPPGAPFNSINGLSSGIGDRRVIFDLNGYNQTFSSIREVVAGNINGMNLIGNSSTNSDSTVTYAGTGTNTWGIQLVDTLDTPAVPHKLGLTVTSGLLELLNTNTYTGPTLVTGGKLLVAFVVPNIISTFAGSLDATPVTVNGTGTFGGNGTVAGNVTIGAGGTLVPGDSYSFLGASGTTPLTRIGQLTLMGTDLTFAPGSRGIFEVNLAAGTNDLVVGIGRLSYGGTLVVSNIGSQVFTNGTVLKLFDASTYVAGAVIIQPAAPGVGLMWDASSLAVNGTLAVVPVVTPTLANIIHLPDGNASFAIGGTVGQGYSVLASTNVASAVTNWTLLQSGSLPSVPYIFTDLSATNYRSRFYRISSP